MLIKAKDYGFTDEQCENAKKATSKYGITVICEDEEVKEPDIVMPASENCENIKEVVGKYGVSVLCEE